MIETIIQTIADILYAYDPQAQLLKDEMEQGTTRPCFFIGCIASSVSPRILDAGIFRTYSLDIRYEPEIGSMESDMHRAAQYIEPELRTMATRDGQYLKGEGIHSTCVDGVLHILVDVTVAVRKADLEEKPEIRSIRNETTVKPAD